MPKFTLPKLLTDLEGRELIWGPPVIRSADDLRPYQNWMAEAIKGLPGVLLGAEMGLGKTASVLKALSDLLRSGEVRRVLIIAPLYVAEETWPDEIAKWTFARGLTYRVVTGNEAERRAALFNGAPRDITIINRENLLWLFQTVGLKGWPFDAIVYDEVSRLQRGALETKPNQRADGSLSDPRPTELGVIDKVRLKTKRFVGLSGTPAPNGLNSLWGPMFAVDGGRRLGTSKSAFDKRWFILDPRSYKAIAPTANAFPEIMERVEDRFFALREEDYLTLPPLIEIDHEVTLPVDLLRRYRAFEREMAIQVRNGAGDAETILAVNEGVLTGKLLQFANGGLYTTEKETIPVHQLKMERLESIFMEAGGTPILVAYSFQFDRDAIKKRFGNSCRIFGDSPNDMRDWNAGQIPMLLLHPASAGHGLNFQAASNIAVWFGLTWSHELYWQFVKRLHRSGQTRDKVFLHRLITRQTADVTILPVLRNKRATEDQIKGAVLARLDERLAA